MSHQNGTSTTVNGTHRRGHCEVCGKNTDGRCQWCNKSFFCSPACYQLATSRHRPLCDNLPNNPHPPRPTPRHSLALHFPANEAVPRWVWVEQIGWTVVPLNRNLGTLGTAITANTPGYTFTYGTDYNHLHDLNIPHNIQLILPRGNQPATDPVPWDPEPILRCRSLTRVAWDSELGRTQFDRDVLAYGQNKELAAQNLLALEDLEPADVNLIRSYIRLHWRTP